MSKLIRQMANRLSHRVSHRCFGTNTYVFTQRDIKRLEILETNGSPVLTDWMDAENDPIIDKAQIKKLKQHNDEEALKELTDVESQGRIRYIENLNKRKINKNQ